MDLTKEGASWAWLHPAEAKYKPLPKEKIASRLAELVMWADRRRMVYTYGKKPPQRAEVDRALETAQKRLKR